MTVKDIKFLTSQSGKGYTCFFKGWDANLRASLSPTEVTLSCGWGGIWRVFYHVTFESPENPVANPNPIDTSKYTITEGWKETSDNEAGESPKETLSLDAYTYWKDNLEAMIASVPEDKTRDILKLQHIKAIWEKAWETLLT